MNNPTEKQVRRIWEWCRVDIKILPETNDKFVVIKGQIIGNINDSSTLDLNNLFKYVVPKVFSDGYHSDTYHLDLIYYTTHCEAHIRPDCYGGKGRGGKHYSTSHKDPALAILSVILDYIGEE